MSADLAAVGAFALAGAGSLAATPLAIRVAERTDFLDRPRGYRKHVRPTPLLGGMALMTAFLAVALVLTGVSGRLIVPLGCAVGMLALGTLDDWAAVAPKWRVLAEIGAAIALYASGLGWATSAGGVVNVGLTVVWVVGLVNAFNLMDNLDGACSTVTAVATAGIGALALLKGEQVLASMAFALSGACIGFLPWNLARPAKIFLGDGGSMPLGLLVAALAMATARYAPSGSAGILVGALLAGVPILDVALVTVSRTRRGVPLVTGGRDHLTHRILLAVGLPRRVAATLALTQGALCALAVLGYELGAGAVAALALTAFAAGVTAVLVLDTARWRPPQIAIGRAPPIVEQVSPASLGADSR